MNKTLIAASLALGLGALAMLGLRPGGEEGPPPVSIGMACVNPVAGCATRIGDHAVSFGAQGRPEPLKPFQLWVKAPGAKSVVASFTMPDMNMGLHVYTWRADGDGVFTARVILPICISGRGDWLITVEIDHAFRLAAPFTLAR